MVDEIKKVPHDEQCDQALEHYLKISNEATHSSSLVPDAIEFYKERYVPRGMRKFITSTKELELALEKGWTFDPWLNPSGRPTIIGDQPYMGDHPALSAVDPREPSVYWILVKGTPEQIAGMDPIAELPDLEEEEEPEPGVEPYGLRVEFIPYGADGKPSRDPQPGYVVMDRGHIYAKGAAYTLPPGAPTSWAVAIRLAHLCDMGVDEAHDVVMGILRRAQ